MSGAMEETDGKVRTTGFISTDLPFEATICAVTEEDQELLALVEI